MLCSTNITINLFTNILYIRSYSSSFYVTTVMEYKSVDVCSFSMMARCVTYTLTLNTLKKLFINGSVIFILILSIKGYLVDGYYFLSSTVH